ncbi:unnamed protein product, partial [Polarella glacialis]
MLDPNAQLVFERQLQDPANLVCCDTGTADPQWASVSHGIYLSIGACGVHRSLGVRVSYVQSMSMDSWKPVHLRMMELGGNERFNDFMAEQGVPRHMPIREKYSTRAARWYRETLRAEAEAEGGPSGSSPRSPLPLEPGTGHLLDDAGAAGSQSSEARQLLDQVFAQVPIQGSMTMGGVPLGSGLPDCQRTCWLAALTGPRSSGRPCSPPAGSSSAPKSAMRTLLLLAFGGGENSGDCRRSSFDSDGESGAGVTKSNFGGVPEVDPAAAVAEGGFKPLPGAGPPVPKSEPARPPGSAPLAAAMMGVPQLAIAAPNSNVWGTPQAMTPALPSFLSAQQPPPPPPDFGGASPTVDFGSVDFAAAAAAAAAKLMGGVVPAPMAAAPAAGLNLGGKGLFGLAGLLSSTTSQASECGDFKRGNCTRSDSCRFAHTGGQASPLSSVGGARPPPPMAGGPRPEIGDDVEVLHNGQWKNGTALGVTGDGLKLLTLIPEEGLQLEIEWNSVRKDGQGMGPSGGVGFSKAGGPPQMAKMQAVSIPSLQSFAKLTFGG